METKINTAQGSENVSQPLPPVCVFHVCVCAHAFTAVKPNKHHPSASQGERTQVGVGVRFCHGWPKRLSHIRVRVCLWPKHEWRVGDLSLTTIHNTVYSASINTLPLVSGSGITVEEVSLISLLRGDLSSRSDATRHNGTKEQYKTSTWIPACFGEFWKPEAFLRERPRNGKTNRLHSSLFILQLTVEENDRCNTCMWLSGFSLEGEIRSVCLQTMPRSQHGRLNQG